jgi:hypothetical protein
LKSVNDGQIILRGWLLLLLVMGVGYVVLEEEKEGVFSRRLQLSNPVRRS